MCNKCIRREAHAPYLALALPVLQREALLLHQLVQVLQHLKQAVVAPCGNWISESNISAKSGRKRPAKRHRLHAHAAVGCALRQHDQRPRRITTRTTHGIAPQIPGRQCKQYNDDIRVCLTASGSSFLVRSRWQRAYGAPSHCSCTPFSFWSHGMNRDSGLMRRSAAASARSSPSANARSA